MRLAILCRNYYDPQGRQQRVGGIETYLFHLAMLALEMNMAPVIFQEASVSFERVMGDLTVVGVPMPHVGRGRNGHALFQAARTVLDETSDLLIFGTDRLAVPARSMRCISIQHGLVCDLPSRYLTRPIIAQVPWLAALQKARARYTAIRNFGRCPNRVCVDYNFLNWYRTFLPAAPAGRIWVIPNFAAIAPAEHVQARERDDRVIRILFARRFTQYRGTRLMARAAQEILRQHDNVCFTFAGEGPDEAWLRQLFGEDDRVRFTRYAPVESMDCHLGHHVAVVPSLGSEGTSLSLAEAMGAGCAVVATAVGGITNMVIDGYNGLLFVPERQQLAGVIERLLVDAALRVSLGRRAYETAASAFSIDLWKERWKNVIQEVIAGG